MWKDYFSFNKRQRNGLIVLLSLMLVMLVWLFISNYIPPANAHINFSAFKSQFASAHNRSASNAGVKQINLNTARKTTLEKNPEIAPYTQAIITYRRELGGFISKKQLLEIPGGMDTLHYRAICNCITIDSAKIRHILLNTASVKKLAKHPYLTHSQAQEIVNYRKRHGNYKQADDLLKDRIINKDTYNKIAPYLKT